ncbi:MAG: ABC transporter ATP-binding protein [Opitutaceae bacterium]
MKRLSPSNPARPVFARLFRLCWHHRRGCLEVLLCQLVLLAFGLAGLGFTGLGIDYLRWTLDPQAPAPAWPFGITQPESWSAYAVLLSIAAAIVAAALMRGALSWLAGVRLAELVHRRVVAELQSAVYAKLQRLSFRFFDTQSTGAILNRATGDVQAVRSFVDTVLIQSVVTIISLAVFTTYMLRVHAALTVACLATLPVLWLACVLFSRVVHPLYLRGRELFDDMVLMLAESIQGMNTIKGFAREREITARFDAANNAVQMHQRRIFWRVSTFTPSIDMLTQFNQVVLLIYGGKLVIDGDLPLGAGLVVFSGLLQQFSNQVSTIAQIANGAQESLAGAGRVFEILDAPPEVESPEHPARPAVWRGAVRFENVSFEYVPGNAVLRDVTLDVAPGGCVAIVGATGAGKSALLGLIPRFYDPSHGRVIIDGRDVRSLDLDELRRRVSVVFQESFVFSNTVAENIAFGVAEASREMIIAAARVAQADEFIAALPEGYDTVLGESGVDLSGGQRQRLAIARALLSNPAILLLDDPTAAIDPETEQEILAAIDRAITGRTTFVVAHRLSTLRRADKIVVLEKGRIVEAGSHAELLGRPGIYRQAAALQMVDEESRRALAMSEDEDAHPIPPDDWPGAGGMNVDAEEFAR